MSACHLTSSNTKNSGLGPEQAAVGDAGGAHVLLGAGRDRARIAVVALLGVGSRMLQRRITAVSSKNGSRTALLSSGISSMSEALIAFQPAIEEPSNILPSSKNSAPTSCAGW
jgi:hypothetical protein